MKTSENCERKENLFKEILSHRKSVFLICMGYTKSLDEAEELTQDCEEMRCLNCNGLTPVDMSDCQYCGADLDCADMYCELDFS